MRRTRTSALCALALFLAAPSGSAQVGSADTAQVRAASKKFQDGERAYRAGDYTLAGDLFEGAYALAPHADALWNAARAWHRAGEKVRAANLYVRFLREAPPNAPDRNNATSALVQLAPKLGKLELQRRTFESVKVDDRPVDGDTLYVAPGRHEVHIEHGGEKDDQSITVGAGAIVSIAFHAQLIAEAAPPPPPAPVPAPREPEPEPKGISPTFVWIGAGLTVTAAGFAIWSGVDTLNARDEYHKQPSKEGVDRGKSKELRTNVLWVVTGGVAVLTALTAFFLVEWKTPRARTSLRANPGALYLTIDY